MLPWFAALMTAAGLLLAGLAAYVAWRRGSASGVSLAVVLLAVAWWGLAYALELSAGETPVKSRWGDLKYIGVCALAPAWLVFVLQYTGRTHLVTRRVIGALAVEPVLVLVVLFNPPHTTWCASTPATRRTWSCPSWAPGRCSGSTSSTPT